ncbi:MAG: phosphate--AMP phosphotransferase [Candidatus Riflebacteria bacterium]|nr:phosphate--AMP phosphotransferase [Candidatus Riflebacteria bacterium]
MLDMVDLGKKLGKAEFKEWMKGAERRINELQRGMKEAGIPTIVVFEGLEAAGKGTCINRLMLPLDPRGFKVHPIHPANEEEAMRPFLYRFWLRLPARGRMAIFDHSWYERVLNDTVEKAISRGEQRSAFDEIGAFERQLADDGALIVKFWMHISRKEQGKRFAAMEKNESLSWKIGKEEKRQHKQYEKYLGAAEEMLEKTNTSYAPWVIVEAHDKQYAVKKIFQTIINTWEGALARVKPLVTAPAAASKVSPKTKEKLAEKVVEKSTGTSVDKVAGKGLAAENVTILSGLDLTKTVSEEEYEKRIAKYQERLLELEHELYVRRVPVVIAFEGCDAAGKGGAIKRLTEHLDPRGYEVMPIAAPTREELDHHYLWRFARNLPKAGHITIFDRTWYGRVLVERVEGFCSEEAWKRAYREINEFEAGLVNFGTVLVKFWLHIDQDEQMRRFKERQDLPWKTWKITEEDWRNREKWPQYERAVNDMLANCSTSYAPFTIVEANDKLHARVKTLKTVIDAIEERLK